MENETHSPGIHNPRVVIPVVRTDRDPDTTAAVDHNLDLAKDKNPSVASPVLSSALRPEARVAVPESESTVRPDSGPKSTDKGPQRG
jgi:hypothetical protein